MNRLSIERRALILKCLVDGNSMLATSRITGASKNTIKKLLIDVGTACAEYQDEILRNLTCKRLQIDEIWSFCYAKQKNVPEDKQGQFGYGDVWTFTAIDADTKLVPSWLVGLRDIGCALEFVNDLKNRLASRVQITTDGHRMYFEAIETAFYKGVDYAIMVKMYGKEPESDKRYSPAECIATEKKVLQGNPDPKQISTSFVERQNLTMRMSMRRFTRLTNGFSKKIENLVHAVALHFMYYNFARPHKSLSKPYPRTPAMAAGVEDHIWTIKEIINLLDSN